MGLCKFCGDPAGFLRGSHPTCRVRGDHAYEKISSLIGSFSSKSEHFDDLSDEVNRLSDEAHLSPLMKNSAIFSGLNRFSTGATEISLPPPAVAQKMHQFMKDQSLLAHAGVIHIKTVHLIEQIETLSLISTRNFAALNTKAALGINYAKDETPIWSFPGTKLYEDRKHTHRVGGGHGVSVRIAKGVYYHTGHFKSHTETTIEHEQIDIGNLLVTDKTLYFTGRAKALKTPFIKIVSIEPCSGGVEVLKSGTNAKPDYYVTGDPWFTTNLINLVMRD